MADKLLLVDGSSKLLLVDGASRLLLTTGGVAAAIVPSIVVQIVKYQQPVVGY